MKEPLKRTTIYLPQILLDKLDSEETSRSESIRRVLYAHYFKTPENEQTDLGEIKMLLNKISEKKSMELESSIILEKIESILTTQPKQISQPDLIHRIMELLSEDDLNTLLIAEKLSEDPSVIFLVLDHMKNENQIKRSGNRWTKI